MVCGENLYVVNGGKLYALLYHRQVLNTPIQATEADILKQTLVMLHERLKPFHASIVLCIHDSVLIETPIESAEEVKEIVQQSMIEAGEVYLQDVPIVVGIELCDCWK